MLLLGRCPGQESWFVSWFVILGAIQSVFINMNRLDNALFIRQ